MHLRYLIVILGISFLFFGCSKKDTVGLFTSSDLNNLSVAYVDTFTVKTYTVALDSLPTFGNKNNSTILLGQYKDPILGTVRAQPYFQVSLNGNFDLSSQVGLSYDSIALVMYYNSTALDAMRSPQSSYMSSYYPYAGDTSILQTFSLYELTQKFGLFKIKNQPSQTGLPLPYFYANNTQGTYEDNFGSQTGYLFNTSSFAYGAGNFLASTNVKPRPHTKQIRLYSDKKTNSNDSIVFRLPDSLGKKWFNYALSRDIRFQAGAQGAPDGNFVNFFKGLTIVPGNTNGAVVSFDPKYSHIRLYYRAPVNGTIVTQYKEFPITLPSINPSLFNHISVDRTGTPFQGIKPFVAIPSEKTNNLSYVQAGTGLMTRVEFPYLHTFITNHPGLVINRAELQVLTGYNTVTSATPTPPAMVLYLTDRTNIPFSVLNQDFSAQPQVSYFYTNPAVTQIGFYKYFLVQYTGALLNSTDYTGTALLMGFPETAMDNSVQRVALGNQLNNASRIRLRIYYSKIANTNN